MAMMGVGALMTITGVGIPVGVALMTYGGYMSTGVSVINATTYYSEKRYGDMGWELGGIVLDRAGGRLAYKTLASSKEVLKASKIGGEKAVKELTIRAETASTFTSFVAGDIGTPNIRMCY